MQISINLTYLNGIKLITSQQPLTNTFFNRRISLLLSTLKMGWVGGRYFKFCIYLYIYLFIVFVLFCFYVNFSLLKCKYLKSKMKFIKRKKGERNARMLKVEGFACKLFICNVTFFVRKCIKPIWATLHEASKFCWELVKCLWKKTCNVC